MTLSSRLLTTAVCFTLALLLGFAAHANAGQQSGGTASTCTSIGGFNDAGQTGGADAEIYCGGPCDSQPDGTTVDCELTSEVFDGPGFKYKDCACDGANGGDPTDTCCHLVLKVSSAGQTEGFEVIGSCPACGTTGTCQLTGGGDGARANAACQ